MTRDQHLEVQRALRKLRAHPEGLTKRDLGYGRRHLAWALEYLEEAGVARSMPLPCGRGRRWLALRRPNPPSRTFMRFCVPAQHLP
jgi:hypothetical protein